MGLGLVNLTNEGTVLSGQISTWSEMEAYMDRAGLIIVYDVDLLDMASGIAWEGGQTIDLGNLANTHTIDSSGTWVRSGHQLLQWGRHWPDR